MKRSDIEMMEQGGTFQLAINKHCVTGYNYKSADDCYKAYIIRLLNGMEAAQLALLKADNS